MNRKFVLAAILAAVLPAAGNAFAGEISVEETPFTSTASRAQVQAELRQFQQSGVNPWSIAYDPLAQFQGVATRSQVTAGYVTSRDAVAAFVGEDSGSSYLARVQGTDTLRAAGQSATAE